MWPTPPLAFLRMMETGVFDHRPTWSCWPPCLIPAGLIRGTREKADGTNLNRDCKDPRTCKITSHVNGIEVQQSFNKTFCLHYDWESPGFYLYELDPGEFPILAYTMVAAASAHCPIETATMIDGREIHDRHHSSNVRPLMRETRPEAISPRHPHTRHSYTIETSSTQLLQPRITTQVAAVTMVLATLVSAQAR